MTLLQPFFCITMCPYTIVLSFEILRGILWPDECSLAPENRFFEGLYTFGGSEPQPHQKYTILRKNGFRMPDASHRSRECPGAFQMTILSLTDILWCKKLVAKVLSVFWAPKTAKSEAHRALVRNFILEDILSPDLTILFFNRFSWFLKAAELSRCCFCMGD